MNKTNLPRINCPRPSFLEGMSRIMDLGGALDDYDLPYLDDIRAGRIPPEFTQPESDLAAMRQDWLAVGQDIGDAMTEIANAVAASGKYQPPTNAAPNS